jgi:hypothetical protein
MCTQNHVSFQNTDRIALVTVNNHRVQLLFTQLVHKLPAVIQLKNHKRVHKTPTGQCHEPAESRVMSTSNFSKLHFNVTLPFIPLVFQVVYSV